MKKLRKFESYRRDGEERKVYWITSIDNKLEDSMVRLFFQFMPYEKDIERVRLINDALSIVLDFREQHKKSEYALILMTFTFNDNEELVNGPYFYMKTIDEKQYLDEDGYIWVGYAPNTDKERYEMYLDTKKYNL